MSRESHDNPEAMMAWPPNIDDGSCSTSHYPLACKDAEGKLKYTCSTSGKQTDPCDDCDTTYTCGKGSFANVPLKTCDTSCVKKTITPWTDGEKNYIIQNYKRLKNPMLVNRLCDSNVSCVVNNWSSTINYDEIVSGDLPKGYITAFRPCKGCPRRMNSMQIPDSSYEEPAGMGTGTIIGLILLLVVGVVGVVVVVMFIKPSNNNTSRSTDGNTSSLTSVSNP